MLSVGVRHLLARVNSMRFGDGDKVAFWLGSLECSNALAGRLVF